MSAGMEQGWRTVWWLWLAGLASLAIVWVGVPIVVPAPARPGDIPVVGYALLAAALFDLAMGWWFKSRAMNPRLQSTFRSKAEATGPLVAFSILAVALGLTPTIFAIVMYLLAGSRALFNAMCLLGLVHLILLRPRRDEWEAYLNGVP